MFDTPRINLDTLLDCTTVTLNDKPTRVKSVTGRVYQQLQSITESSDPMIVYQIAKQCLPDLTEDEVFALTTTQVKAVLAIASDNLSEVEGLFPNPETPMETVTQPSA